ncbi:MAG: hypothetical protein RL588_1607 [Pseudomonadota bacterium]|jgi:hypothetical protein
MWRILLPALACLLVLSPPAAFAAGEKKKEGGATSEADLRIDLSGIGLPIMKDGRVVNFVFIRARIQLNPGLTKADIDAREPFIREGLVRSAYRTPLNSGAEYMAVDPKKFEAALMREAKAALGANKVKSVELRDQKAQKRIYVPPTQGGTRRDPIQP